MHIHVYLTHTHTTRHSELKGECFGENILFVMNLPISPSLQNQVFQLEGVLASDWERRLWFVKFFSCKGRKDILPCGLELHSKKLLTDFHTLSEGAFPCTVAVFKRLAEALDQVPICFYECKEKAPRH